MFDVKIVKDSFCRATRRRLTTVEMTYPRFIHAEIMTHRDRARNAASSRAIPWPKMMLAITQDPVIPIYWGSEQRGMQTGEEINQKQLAEKVWLDARDAAVEAAHTLAGLGVHKSICNRLTEPFMWITVIMSATQWKNFFRLRCHPDAEVHFQKIANMTREYLAQHIPDEVVPGRWHLPYIQPEELAEWGESDYARKVSVARCARVSYLTHDGIRDPEKDIQLFDRLVQGSGFGHWSPHEHVAMAVSDRDERSGPFVGWRQFRKFFQQECAD